VSFSPVPPLLIPYVNAPPPAQRPPAPDEDTEFDTQQTDDIEEEASEEEGDSEQGDIEEEAESQTATQAVVPGQAFNQFGHAPAQVNVGFNSDAAMEMATPTSGVPDRQRFNFPYFDSSGNPIQGQMYPPAPVVMNTHNGDVGNMYRPQPSTSIPVPHHRQGQGGPGAMISGSPPVDVM
jgi:hypothetical protein